MEWNALGLHDVSMSAIAEGISVNSSVEVLDLSNNQICQGGARLLCLALKRNKTLKSLDMRWNNIGVVGGREFLSALQHNKTLVALQLAGMGSLVLFVSMRDPPWIWYDPLDFTASRDDRNLVGGHLKVRGGGRYPWLPSCFLRC